MTSNTISTSCATHSFDYEWTIKDLETRVMCKETLDSPFFYPDFTIGGYKTRWNLRFSSSPSIVCNKRMSCLTAKAVMTRLPGAVYGLYNGVFAERSISVLVPGDCKGVSATSPIFKEAKKNEIGSKASWLTFDNQFNPDVIVYVTSDELTVGKSEYTYNNSLTVRLNMKVYLVDQPKHDDVPVVAQPIVPKFDLPKAMEDARVNDIFTDVILVSGEREFKAHRVILASQSPFFKTRFKQRWKRQDDKVDMSDIAPDILEAMMSFMYTGDVANVDSISHDLLPAAEEYRLSGLKEICERALLKNLKVNNAVRYLKLASTHSAENLERESTKFIVANPSVQKSKGWKSLDKSDPVRLGILEAWSEKLV